MKENAIKTLKNLLFFIILVLITFYVLFRKQDPKELLNIIISAKTNYVLIGILLMLLYFLAEAYNVKIILKTLNDRNIPIIKALKYTFIGFFFSSITPAASGGQPVEIYYMTKEKIKGENATLAMLIILSGFQICTILLGIICAILNPQILTSRIIPLFVIGVIINGFVLSIMMICIFSKKLTKKLINIIIKLINFFKFKNKEKIAEKLLNAIEKYNESSAFIISHKKEYIKSILIVLIQVIIYYSVPFCIVKAFDINTYNYFQIFTMQSILHTAVSSMPLPGTIGVSELVFLDIFNPVFGTKKLNGAMLLNRGITFYLYVILSLLVVTYNYIKINRKKESVSNDN